MDQTRDTTVLFADVSGSTRIYEAVGDAAAVRIIESCIAVLRSATESAGGTLPAVGEASMGVRIGFHFGPVMQREGDVFGDTVNLAARLVEQAGKGQIITSRETMELLGPLFRRSTRRLYSIQVKGRANEVELCELLWNQDADMTQVALEAPRSRPATVALRLKYRGEERTLRRNPDSITLGRDPQAEMVVADGMASRRHCTIERRQDKFVLIDHSSNGTYVTVEGDAEITLRREELVLRKRGWIAFGHPRDAGEEIVEYFCD